MSKNGKELNKEPLKGYIKIVNQFTASLWGDEGFSAILSMKPLPEIIKIIINDTSPPLWNITEWIVFNTLGTNEVYIRGLAFLYFSLTVFFVYKIGEHLWDRRTGLISAVLTFLNPFFFIYAFEGRMYSILALGVTASTYFFLRRRWAPYVISAAWAMYSHHFAIFAIFLQGLWFVKEFFWGKREVARGMFKAFIALGVVYLPWVYPLYNQAKMVGGGFWLGTPTVKELIGLITEYLATGINHKLAEPALYLVLATLLFRKWHKKTEKSVFLFVWFLGPIILTFLVSQVFQSIFFNRYLLYTIPAAMLLIGSERRKISNVLIPIIIILFTVIDFNYFTHPVKLPFRQLAEYVKSTQTENNFLINWNSSAHHLWETKYYGIPAPIYVPEGGELPFFVGTALMEESDIINQIPEGIKRVGVVTTGSFEEIKLAGYTEKERKEIKGLKFVWYEKK